GQYLIYLPLAQMVQPPIRPHPKPAIAVIRQSSNRIAGQPLTSSKHRKVPPVKPAQPRVQRPHPDVPRAILNHRPGVVARQPFAGRKRNRPPVEELIQSMLGADPKAPFAIFEKRVDRALRKPVLGAK